MCQDSQFLICKIGLKIMKGSENQLINDAPRRNSSAWCFRNSKSSRNNQSNHLGVQLKRHLLHSESSFPQVTGETTPSTLYVFAQRESYIMATFPLLFTWASFPSYNDCSLCHFPLLCFTYHYNNLHKAGA